MSNRHGRRRILRGGAAGCMVATLLIAACAIPERVSSTFPLESQWSGRLALKTDGTPPQAFGAAFELAGDAQTGQLTFFTPLGTTAAQLRWAPGQASLSADGAVQQFDALDALVRRLTGTALPVQALFDWLQGIPSAADGWEVDLSQHAQGRVVAVRTSPDQPRAELRLVVQRR